MITKILLDECLPRKLLFRIEELDSDFLVKTTPDIGWAGLVNGKLLNRAENEFDVFVTSDRNLSFQQPISSTSLLVILLKGPTNTYEDLLPLISKIKPILQDPKSGQMEVIE